MTLDEIYSVLRLKFMDIEYPPPPHGNGENVIEFNGKHSWPCFRAALEALSDDNFEKVVNSRHVFSFHNNSNSGHTSVGADWSIKSFIIQNGGSKLQKRLNKISH